MLFCNDIALLLPFNDFSMVVTMALAGFVLSPFYWGGKKLSQFFRGDFSLFASVIITFFVFSFFSLVLLAAEYMFTVLQLPNAAIYSLKALLLFSAVNFLHVALWRCSSRSYALIKLAIRLLIINNTIIILTFTLSALGLIKVDQPMLTGNPNIPVKIR